MVSKLPPIKAVLMRIAGDASVAAKVKSHSQNGRSPPATHPSIAKNLPQSLERGPSPQQLVDDSFHVDDGCIQKFHARIVGVA